LITYEQLLLAVSIPTFVALIGLLFNRLDMREIRTDHRTEMLEIRTLINHFIDRHINNENRISTLEERSKPKGTN
jgi:hypothetical protein